ncbi:hypothetical protein [Streptomyces fulvoviolaceus]|uniref:hypothetical protein n=2 Tax=Streptomyces fulvoviolaceus TaxID=285535 RepID=UPI0021BFB62C|nr:hypothetical protein [Streptomyces fulvoviolaceus]MCT9077876.1 hypothetical protein [Streptomyces fulvoviolaceus]
MLYGWRVEHRMQDAAVLGYDVKRHLGSSVAGGFLLLGPLGALAGAAMAGSPLTPRRIQVWVDNTGHIWAKGI